MPTHAFRRAVASKLAPIARRDAQITDLENQLVAARAELSGSARKKRLAEYRRALNSVPSFQRELFRARRQREYVVAHGMHSASIIGHGKPYVLALMESHDVDVPRTLGTWPSADDIEWHALPDLVVVKGSRGAGSRGVYPMRRVGDQWQVLTHPTPLSSDDVVREIHALEADDHISGPYYAEEFLGSPDGEIPVDIKAYTFAGRTPLILLRRAAVHGDAKTATFRIVGADGEDIVHHYRGRPTDTTIPVPNRMGDVLATADRISTILRTPFVRIDLYEHEDRVVFGEITPRPGGRQWMGAAIDRMLGEHWEEAEMRLWNDRVNGAALLPQLGTAGRSDPPKP